jgi:arginase family enzyme
MLDIVELNPTYDMDGRTSRLAARMIAIFLAGVANRQFK